MGGLDQMDLVVGYRILCAALILAILVLTAGFVSIVAGIIEKVRNW